MALTAEGVALELGRALAPLERRLSTPQGALSMFAEIGLPLPPPVAAEIQNAPELGQIVSAVADVGAELPALAAAVAADAAPDIAVALAVIAPRAATAVARVQALGHRVRIAFGSDLSPFESEVRDLISRLPERIIAWLFVLQLQRRHPTLCGPLTLAGIVDSVEVPGTAAEPGFVRRDLRFDRILDLFSRPGSLARSMYHWAIRRRRWTRTCCCSGCIACSTPSAASRCTTATTQR